MKSSIINILPKINFLKQINNTGDFKTAASQLSITPSALTQSIKSLESHFEQTFIIREKGKVILTSEGLDLIERLSPMLEDLEKIDQHFFNNKVPSRLRLGAYESMAIRFFPKIHSKMIELNPQIKIDLLVGRTSELCTQIHQGHLDMALVVDSPESDSFHSTTIAYNELSIFTRKENIENGKLKESIALGCLRTQSDGRQDFLTKALNALELKSKDFSVQTDSFEALLSLCLNGNIAVILPVYLANRHKEILIDVADHYNAPNIKKVTRHPLSLITRKTFPEAWRNTIEDYIKDIY